MHMSRVVYLSLVLLLSMLVLPMATTAQENAGGNVDNAAKCRDGGYRFTNPGECMRYVAQGGSLEELARVSVEFVTDVTGWSDATVLYSASGLPSETALLRDLYYPNGDYDTFPLGLASDDGSVSGSLVYTCGTWSSVTLRAVADRGDGAVLASDTATAPC